MRDHTRAFAQTAAVYQDDQRVIGSGNAAEAVSLGLVSAGFWSMFDAPPAIGRYFTADEDRPPRGSNVLVLGYGYWRSRFGADPKVLGRPLRVEGKIYTVIGVAPNGFHGIWATATAAYAPITAGGFDMLGNERYHLGHNMTHRTLSITTWMSASGSPSTATRSAK